MKRILCLIDYLGAGGAQRQMLGLAKCLKEKGYDVILSTYFDQCFYQEDLSSHGIQFVCIKNAGRVASRPWYIARFIRRVHPDVVISYLETPSICACIARMFNHRFKLIVSERNTNQRTWRSDRIRFNLFRWADYVVPNAYAQGEYIQRSFPFLTKKVKTIPNFVDLELFVPPTDRKRRAVPEVLVAATIWPPKNTLGFIDAVASMKEKGLRFHISWYGLNEQYKAYCDQCIDKIKRLGVDDCLELEGKTLQIKKCYQNADFFCLPSFYEGTPNVICEAMACGLPVVCSDVCDNSRYVIDGENGALFNPKDTDSIVAAFERLFSLSDEEYKSYCHHSRKLAEQKLSKEAFLNAYLKLIGN